MFGQSGNGSTNQLVEIPNIGLKDITIKTFQSPIDLSNFSIFSWVSFFGILLIVLIVVYWVWVIIKIGVLAIQSEGNQEKLQEVAKRFRAIFLSMALFFLFPVALSLIGIFLGIGNIFQWPKMFSFCNVLVESDLPSSPRNVIFYYQVFLGEGEGDFQKADLICYPSNT